MAVGDVFPRFSTASHLKRVAEREPAAYPDLPMKLETGSGGEKENKGVAVGSGLPDANTPEG